MYTVDETHGMTLKLASSGGSFDFYHNDSLYLTGLDGMGVNAEVVTQDKACASGAWYKYTRIPPRSITIEATYLDIPYEQVITTRALIHNICAPGEPITITYNGGWRQGTLTGYVEKCEDTENDYPMTCSISLICPDPFFEGDSVTTNLTGDDIITYDGTASTGITVKTQNASDVHLTINNRTIEICAFRPQFIAPVAFANGVVPKRLGPKQPDRVFMEDVLGPQELLDTSIIEIKTDGSHRTVFYGPDRKEARHTINPKGSSPILVPGENHIVLTNGTDPIAGELTYITRFGGV